jgi:moderate conductance mechanosensitive channel
VSPQNAVVLLAQEESPDLDLGLVEFLRDRVGDNDFLLLIIDTLLSPGLNILLILVLASIASLLAKRAVRKAVARAKEPSDGRRSGFKRRIGLSEGSELTSLRRAQRAEAVGALAGSVLSVVIWTMALFMVLGQFGINLGPLIAGAGIVGVALGFGAQDLVKDFLSGVFMLLEDQYGVGDIIDAGEAIGVVEGVSLRTTRVRDVTGTLWHVPNGEIARIGNMSQDWARALLDVGVSYGTDVDAASDIILGVATDMAHEEAYEADFLGDPEVWGVQDLGADSVDIRLVIQTTPGTQWGITRELRRRIKAAFDAAGMEIPFPQRTVWLRTEQPVSFGDGDAPVWRDEVPSESVRARAIAAASKGGQSTISRNEFNIPDADEAGEHGVDDVAADADETS